MIPAVTAGVVGFALLTAHWFPAGVLLALVLVALVLPEKMPLDKIGQIIVALFWGAAVYTWYFVVQTPPEHRNPTQLGFLASAIAAGLLGIAAIRLLLKAPHGGNGATAAVMVLALLALGSARLSHRYTLVAVVGFALLFVGMWRGAAHRPVASRMSPAHRSRVAWTVLVAVLLSVAGVVVLPAVYQRVMSAYMKNRWSEKSGFSSHMRLGALSNLFLSRRPVLRVMPPEDAQTVPTHLRAVVHNRYVSTRWLFSGAPTAEAMDVDTSPTSPQAIQVLHLGERDRVFFTPLHTGDIAAPEGQVSVSATGVLSPLPGAYAHWIAFAPRPGESINTLAPVEGDREVPVGLHPFLAALAAQMIGDDLPPAQSMARLMSALARDYRYQLTVPEAGRLDPLAAFLMVHKQGHCEYFASALALLARTRGIPTRVVSGYLVSEWNPLGRWFIVRERNAHSWVEAWIDGRWRTYDPTPPASLPGMRAQSSTAAAALDYASWQIDRMLDFMAALTALQLVLLVSVLLGIWVAVRVVRRLRQTRATSARSILAYRPLDPLFAEFLARMAAKGFSRQRAEPLSAFADRVARDMPSGEAAAALVRRYEAVRFGGADNVDVDTDALAAALAQWLG
ncbi:MAG: DUF3488 and transglutaminase-like domain-containing protein [Proteobacteria bacterium]|nr:DUF3488 and transglutaminase-like domain-containing protein [Pseudomonadota bacterium]